MTSPGYCVTATAVATRGMKSGVMAAIGVTVGFVLWMSTTMALAPFSSFTALGTGPFVAASVFAIFVRRSIIRPCGAPEWAQRCKAAFWLGALLSLTYVCVGMAYEAPQPIPFWPRA